MGQYHVLVNFDKKEMVHPHKLGLGLKQQEHTSGHAVLSDALYLLVVSSPNRGGGDLDYCKMLEASFKTFGRWLGDRVAVWGDYTEPEDAPFLTEEQFEEVGNYSDITDMMIPAFEKAFSVSIELTSDGGRSRDD